MARWDLDRRRFLAAMGAGTAATFLTAGADAEPRNRPRSVAILGGGMAGLVAALELQRHGIGATVLEARRRVGGLAWTIRDGDLVSHRNEEEQVARFAGGNYLNAGAGRIPNYHDHVLALARELRVPLEVYVHESRANFLLRDGAADAGRVRLRQVANDLRGHLSEMLEAAIRTGALDQSLAPDTRRALAQFLKLYGDLDRDGRYRGSTRSGYARQPGATLVDVPVAVPPLTLDDLLRHTQTFTLLYEEDVLMQPTMLQPVGGMDNLPRAIASALRTPVRLGAEVRQVRRHEDGVAIVYRDGDTNRDETLLADHAIITLPIPLLRRVANDFAAPVRKAIASVAYSDAIKVAFESPPFWEMDGIYGGNSYVTGDTGVVWYPSGSFQRERQVLVGAYAWYDLAARLGARTRDEQVAQARAMVERLHPGHGKDLANPIVVDWRRTPFSEGPWVEWEAPGNDPAAAGILNAGDGPFSFAGSYLSAYSGEWMEGAVLSARRAVGRLAGTW
jgi:monoamine oxidase